MSHRALRRIVILAAFATHVLAAWAQTTPGAYDTSFGSGGTALIELGAPTDFQPVASVSLPDGRFVLGGNAALDPSCGGMAFARFNVDGTLDATFGSAGWLKVPPAGCSFGYLTTLEAMAASPYGDEIGFAGHMNGGLVVGTLFGAGFYLTTTEWDLGSFVPRAMSHRRTAPGYIVAGYDNREPAGTPGRTTAFLRFYNSVDRSFGVNGVLKQAFGTETDEAAGVVADYDGSFYFTGSARDAGSATGTDLVVGKLRENGTLETAWGDAGRRILDYNGLDDAGAALMLDSSHVLVVAGSATTAAGVNAARWPALLRLDAATGQIIPGSTADKPLVPLAAGNDGGFVALTELGPSGQFAGAATVVDRATGRHSLMAYRFGYDLAPAPDFGNQGMVALSSQADARGVHVADPYARSFFTLASMPTAAVLASKFDAAGIDPSYGGGFGRGFDLVRGDSRTIDEGGAMAMLADGGFVLVGQARVSGTTVLGGVVRLDANGQRDTSFGTSNGVAYLKAPADSWNFFPRAVAAYGDGRIVVGSVTAVMGEPRLVVGRLLANGLRDPAWNGGNDVSMPGGNELMAMAVRQDGAVLLAGSGPSRATGLNRMQLARLLSDGSPDSSFGTGGVLTIENAGSADEHAQGLLLEADGGMLIPGDANDGAGVSRFAVLRLLPNGALDANWGSAGRALGPETGSAFGAARQADGKLVVAGDCSRGFVACFVRFLPSGAIDASFGTAGSTQLLFNGSYSGLVGVAVQADGKVVGGGDASSFMLARLRASGQLDASFNGGTVESMPHGQARTFAMQPDGKLVIAGRSLDLGDLAIARHLGGGDDSPDPFTFTPVTGAALSTSVTGAPVTPTGYDVATNVLVTNGEAAIGCTGVFSTNLVIRPGNALCVRHVSASQPGTTVTTSVALGDTVATFSSTTIAIDTTITSVAQPSPGAATIAFTSNIAGATFECRLDGGAFEACATPKSYSALSNGLHTFEARAVSGSSVDATPASASFTVDVTAPETTINDGPAGSVATKDASFGFSSSEAGSTFECRLDAGAFAACTSPKAFTSLAEGAHTFEVAAIDAAGNRDATPAARTWTVDTQAPDAAITSGPAGTVATANAMLAFGSSDASASFECRLDGAAFAACTSPKSYAGLPDGAHVFEVRAIDAAGNRTAVAAQRSWIIDTTAPDTAITAAPAGVVASATAAIAFQSSETGSTFRCRLDAAAFAACSSPVSVSGLAQGDHTFEVYASDAVGNADATPASATWTVDTVPPDTTITGGPSGNNNPPTATFTFAATEAGSRFECMLDGTVFTACASPQTYGNLPKGSHTFQVRAIDAAGNVDATPATATWRSNN